MKSRQDGANSIFSAQVDGTQRCHLEIRCWYSWLLMLRIQRHMIGFRPDSRWARGRLALDAGRMPAL